MCCSELGQSESFRTACRDLVTDFTGNQDARVDPKDFQVPKRSHEGEDRARVDDELRGSGMVQFGC